MFLLAKTLYSHTSSLQPGVQMGTSKFNAARGNPATSILSRVEMKYSWSLRATELGITNLMIGHLARMREAIWRVTYWGTRGSLPSRFLCSVLIVTRTPTPSLGLICFFVFSRHSLSISKAHIELVLLFTAFVGPWIWLLSYPIFFNFSYNLSERFENPFHI